MRDLERQARVAELKKQAAESVAAANAVVDVNGVNSGPAATLASPEGTEAHPIADVDARITEALVITRSPDSVARLDASIHQPAQETLFPATSEDSPAVAETSPKVHLGSARESET